LPLRGFGHVSVTQLAADTRRLPLLAFTQAATRHVELAIATPLIADTLNIPAADEVSATPQQYGRSYGHVGHENVVVAAVTFD